MNAIVRQDAQPELPQAEGATLLAVISRAASDPQTDVAKMERLMAMYERVEAKRAESAFNDAMSEAQKRVRGIGVDATNTQTKSKYATYPKLNRVLRPIYTECGFALSFNSEPSANPDSVLVLCHVSHAGGHCRTYRLDMPADGKGAKGNDVMTKTHAVGSAVQYGMRYLLKMIFNVAVGDEDDDGNAAGAHDAAEYEPDPERDRMIANLFAAADEGSSKIAQVWKEMTPAQRARIGETAWQEAKNRAEQADRKDA